MKLNRISQTLLTTLAVSILAPTAIANESKASIDFRLRYENVSQDNALKDADALTLRTKFKLQNSNLQQLFRLR